MTWQQKTNICASDDVNMTSIASEVTRRLIRHIILSPPEIFLDFKLHLTVTFTFHNAAIIKTNTDRNNSGHFDMEQVRLIDYL